MLPTVIEETEDLYQNCIKPNIKLEFLQKTKLPLNLNTYIKFYWKSLVSQTNSSEKSLLLNSTMTDVQSVVPVTTVKVEDLVSTVIQPSTQEVKEETKTRKDSETGDEGESKKNNRRNGNRSKRGLPRRNGRNDRRRFQYNRSWEKTHEEGMVITHVLSPTQVYMQTQRQQVDYKNLQECMAKSYGGSNYKPSIVAANMLLGVKINDVYERVRTEEIKEESSQSEEKSSDGKIWKVILVDRGSTAFVQEDSLNFLLAGLNDLQPLAIKYTLNELRICADATETLIEECKKWLAEKTSGEKVDCEIFKPNRDNSVYYVDIFLGDKLLNSELVNIGAVEPKGNFRWKSNQRTSTSSLEDVPPSPVSEEEGQENGSVEKTFREKNNNNNNEDLKEGEENLKGSQRSRSTSRRSNRGNKRWFPNSRRRSTMNSALKDWAVVCYDSNTSHSSIRSIVDSMMKSDNTVARPEDIHIQQDLTEMKDMVNHIASVAHAKTNLALILCVPPENLENYGELEVAGQSLGVSVVFARGATLGDQNQDTSARLLKELQEKYKQSPAYVPAMSGNSPNYGNMNGTNRRRRDRFWNQNRQRNYSKWESRNGTDTLLTSLKDLTSVLRNMQLDSCEGNLDSSNPSPLTVQLSRALQNLQDVQTNYKQTRAHCIGALGAATMFLANLSTIVTPATLHGAADRV